MAAIPSFHNIIINFKFCQIQIVDPKIIEIFKKQCIADRFDVHLIDRIANQVIFDGSFEYCECERIAKEFEWYYNTYDKEKDGIKSISINDRCKICADHEVITRIYRFFNSYVNNHMSLQAMYRMLLQGATASPTVKNVEEQKERKIVHKDQEVTEIQVNEVHGNQLNTILELCMNSVIKSSAIHYALKYFRYVSAQFCSVEKNDNKTTINCPMILPTSFILDKEYIQTLVTNNFDLDVDKTKFACQALFKLLMDPEYNNQILLVMFINYLLFIYVLRMATLEHDAYVRTNLLNIINSSVSQNKMFDYVLKRYFDTLYDKIEVKFKEYSENITDENKSSEEIVKQLSEQHKHLKKIDENEFINKVLSNIDENSTKTPTDFYVTNKKIIDIEKFLSITNNINSKAFNNREMMDLLFNNVAMSQVESNDKYYNYAFLDYKNIGTNGRKIITPLYKYFLDYIKDSASILMLKDKVQPEILNMFEILANNVLTSAEISPENCDTISYYDLLLKKLPNASNFHHDTLLRVVFEIIIPYQYDVNNITKFEDCLI
jgi:hypothetical protein